jgi:hypothetical protein
VKVGAKVGVTAEAEVVVVRVGIGLKAKVGLNDF